MNHLRSSFPEQRPKLLCRSDGAVRSLYRIPSYTPLLQKSFLFSADVWTVVEEGSQVGRIIDLLIKRNGRRNEFCHDKHILI